MSGRRSWPYDVDTTKSAPLTLMPPRLMTIVDGFFEICETPEGTTKFTV